MEKSKLKSLLLRNLSTLGTLGMLNKWEGGGGGLGVGKLGGGGEGGGKRGKKIVAANSISSVEKFIFFVELVQPWSNLQVSDVWYFI